MQRSSINNQIDWWIYLDGLFNFWVFFQNVSLFLTIGVENLNDRSRGKKFGRACHFHASIDILDEYMTDTALPPPKPSGFEFGC